MMMNIVSLAMLSLVGSVILLAPEPMLVRSSADGQNSLEAVEDLIVRGVEGVTKPVEKSLGWSHKQPKPQDHLAAAREKAADARQAFQEASAHLKDAMEEKAVDAFHETGKYLGDEMSRAVRTAKDAAVTAEESTVESAHTLYNQAYDAAAEMGDSVGSAIRRTASRAKESAEDIYDSTADTFGATKVKTNKKVGEAKDKVYEVAENAHDAVANNVKFGVDKTKGTASDVAEKAKETWEHVVHETKEAGQGILGRAKDAACRTAECLGARAHEDGSFLPHVGQGIAYVQNDEKTAAESLKRTPSNAQKWTQNTATQFYNMAKDTAGDYYQGGRDWTEDMYDSGRDTAREYYDEAGRHYRSARDYYDRLSDYSSERGGRQQYRDHARNSAPSRDCSAAKEEAEDFYDHWIRDSGRDAYRSAKDTARDYYDDARDRMGRHIPGRHQERPRDYYGGRRRRAPESYRGARSADEEYYERAKFKPDDLNDLGAMVESMGWRRVGKVPKDPLGVKFSQEDVLIGDVKYVWHEKGQSGNDEFHDTAFRHMTNSVKGAAHTVGEKLGLVKDLVKDGTKNVRDSNVRAKDQAYDSWAKRPHYRGEYDNERNGEDESIITKRVQNLKEGVRNPGQAYEAQRSKAGEYANKAHQELSRFAGFKEGDKASKGGHYLRLWKDLFIRKPEGMLLTLTRALHLFAFSIVYGSAIWVTFVSGLILSKHVPRQQFGYVQSRMFPVYLRILAVGEGVLLLLHSLMHPWFSSKNIEQMQLVNFSVMITSTVLNAYVLEPRATKVMFERLKVEKEEKRGLEHATNPADAKKLMEDQKKRLVSINEEFKLLHGYSSALNLISLGGLTCHLWHLANRLVV